MRGSLSLDRKLLNLLRGLVMDSHVRCVFVFDFAIEISLLMNADGYSDVASIRLRRACYYMLAYQTSVDRCCESWESLKESLRVGPRATLRLSARNGRTFNLFINYS
jgi:hypothetical protein